MLLIELMRRDAVSRVLQLDYEIIERGTTAEYETV
jgi:hypothetical protein